MSISKNASNTVAEHHREVAQGGKPASYPDAKFRPGNSRIHLLMYLSLEA